MEVVKIESEFIKLDQFLKWAGVVGSGVEAKLIIQEAIVNVNGEVEVRRGKKLYNGDIVELENRKFKVESVKEV